MTPQPIDDFSMSLRLRSDVFEFFRAWGYSVQLTEWDFAELPERYLGIMRNKVGIAEISRNKVNPFSVMLLSSGVLGL